MKRVAVGQTLGLSQQTSCRRHVETTSLRPTMARGGCATAGLYSGGIAEPERGSRLLEVTQQSWATGPGDPARAS